MYLFSVSPLVLRAPSTNCPEILPHGRNLAEFYNPTPKIRGALPQKNLGSINMQNFRQFWTTSDFDREYPRNGWRYPKSAAVTNYGNSSCVQRKKSRELCSTNGLELHVSLDPLKVHFLAHYISAFRGCSALKFLHALDIDQALLAHTQSGAGVPQKIWIVKIKNRAWNSTCEPQ